MYQFFPLPKPSLGKQQPRPQPPSQAPSQQAFVTSQAAPGTNSVILPNGKVVVWILNAQKTPMFRLADPSQGPYTLTPADQKIVWDAYMLSIGKHLVGPSGHQHWENVG